MAQRPGPEMPLAAVIALVVCPVCRQALAAKGAAVLCTGCGRRYAVRDGIPVLIADASPHSPNGLAGLGLE